MLVVRAVAVGLGITDGDDVGFLGNFRVTKTPCVVAGGSRRDMIALDFVQIQPGRQVVYGIGDQTQYDFPQDGSDEQRPGQHQPQG